MTTTRRWLVGSAVAVLAIVAVSSAAMPARTATPTHVDGHQSIFQDPTGDASASADIATVVVSNDDAGFLSFQLLFVGKPKPDLTVLAHLDVDGNAATGARAFFGAEYEVAVWNVSAGGNSFSLRRWTGKAFKEFFSRPPDVTLKGGVLTFAFATSDLGTPSDFRFALATKREGKATFDRAPDNGKPPWAFHVQTAPVRLSVVGLKTRPTPPKAGRTFIASMTVKPSASVADLVTRIDGPTCNATVGATRLTVREGSMNGFAGSPRVIARCSWRIPPGTHAKLLRGSVKVTFLGKALTRSFSVRIS